MREGNVFGDRAVKQKIVLQDHAKLGAVISQADRSQVSPIYSHRPESGRLKAITKLISVLFPEPLEPTSAVVEPAAA